MSDEGEVLTKDEQRNLIEASLARWGYYEVDKWIESDPDNSGRLKAVVGRGHIIEDDEGRGLFEGDEGMITAGVVGALKYRNVRVAWWFEADGFDSGIEFQPGESVEVID